MDTLCTAPSSVYADDIPEGDIPRLVTQLAGISSDLVYSPFLDATTVDFTTADWYESAIIYLWHAELLIAGNRVNGLFDCIGIDFGH